VRCSTSMISSRRVSEDAVHPSGERRPSFELMNLAKRQQERVLKGILGILLVPEHPSCRLPQLGETRGKKFVQLRGIHFRRQPFAPRVHRSYGFLSLDHVAPSITFIDIPANPRPHRKFAFTDFSFSVYYPSFGATVPLTSMHAMPAFSPPRVGPCPSWLALSVFVRSLCAQQLFAFHSFRALPNLGNFEPDRRSNKVKDLVRLSRRSLWQ
jgi:hypothetical protein